MQSRGSGGDHAMQSRGSGAIARERGDHAMQSRGSGDGQLLFILVFLFKTRYIKFVHLIFSELNMDITLCYSKVWRCR